VKDKSSFPIYRLAITLSIVAHLFFVSTLEAAAFFGKSFVSPVHDPVVIIQTASRPSLRSESSSVVVRRKDKKEPLKKEEAKLDHNNRQVNQIVKTSKSSVKPKGIKHSSLQNGVFQSFQNFQARLDQRIQKFKDDLKTLATQQQELNASNSLMSEVSDLEKVPVEIRRDLLPEYLEKMRFRIAERWLQQVRALSLQSGTATVYYRIAQNGTISVLNWKSSENNGLFLNSCLKAVEGIDSFGVLPFQFDEMEKDKYLTVGLTFYLRKQNQKTLFSLDRFRP